MLRICRGVQSLIPVDYRGICKVWFLPNMTCLTWLNSFSEGGFGSLRSELIWLSLVPCMSCFLRLFCFWSLLETYRAALFLALPGFVAGWDAESKCPGCSGLRIFLLAESNFKVSSLSISRSNCSLAQCRSRSWNFRCAATKDWRRRRCINALYVSVSKFTFFTS